jgi:hypothetical protein
MLTAEQSGLYEQAISPASEHAHAPMRSLLLRVWSEDPDQLHDSETGHACRMASLHVSSLPALATSAKSFIALAGDG